MFQHKYSQPFFNKSWGNPSKIYQKISYKSPTTKYYFAYGSNLNRARMAQRGALWEHAQKGTLQDYDLDFGKSANLTTGEGYANIFKKKKSQVEGIIYRLENKNMANSLDVYEGTNIGHYKRIEVEVQLRNGKSLKCFTYTACQRHKGLIPSKVYLSHLLQGAHYLSKDYIEKLKEFGHTIDTPFRVFVYGTLKTGHGNNSLMSGYQEKIECEIPGKLYVDGLPYAKMEDTDIYSEASVNIKDDYHLQEKLQKELDTGHYWANPDTDHTIHGELYIFPSWEKIQQLDQLEGFSPSREYSLYHRILTSCYDYKGDERSCWIYISKKEFPEEAFEASGDYEQTYNASGPILYNQSTWEKEHDSKFHNKYELEELEEQQYQREIKNEYLRDLHGVSEYDPDIDPSWSEDATPEDKEALRSLFQKGKL